MPEPAMITAPPSISLIAMDEAVSRVKRNPGRSKGSSPLRISSRVSRSKHSGWCSKIWVAEMAMGESRKTLM
jgi:hypothetical protein